jgi:hypothetical protein
MKLLAVSVPVLSALLCFAGCQKSSPPAASATSGDEPAFRAPTATEVFDLRTKCAELGEKIMKNTAARADLKKEELSHYEPKTNRCYVRLTLWNGNVGKGDEDFQQYLYDGQTGQMLAAIRRQNGVKSGDIYSDPPPSQGGPEEMYVDASIFISQMMADDRQH